MYEGISRSMKVYEGMLKSWRYMKVYEGMLRSMEVYEEV